MSECLASKLDRIEEKLDEVLRQMECESGPFTDLGTGIQEVLGEVDPFLSKTELPWVAMDEDGEWFAFDSEPHQMSCTWYSDLHRTLGYIDGDNNTDWKESKRKIR